MSAIKTPEPVVLTHAITVLLGGLVAAGWMTIPSTSIDAIATAAAVVISFGLAIWARSKVTPTGASWQTRIEEIVAGAVQDVLSNQLNLSPTDPSTSPVPSAQDPAPSRLASRS